MAASNDEEKANSESRQEPQILELQTVSGSGSVSKISIETKTQSLTLRRTPRNAQGYIEPLLDVADAIPLHVVLIPGGTFTMGSPEDEPERFDREGPQHEVTISTFFMGRYPVTQAQYEAVMGSNPATEYDTDRFVAPNRPVIGVTWHDAVEFCQRLTELSNRPYRLPSEAEWEYACRAGTTTPFYFGRIINTEIANYNGDCNNQSGPVSFELQRKDLEKKMAALVVEYQVCSEQAMTTLDPSIKVKLEAQRQNILSQIQATENQLKNSEQQSNDYIHVDNLTGVNRNGSTPVDYFRIANAFGLADMHGNVYEWCQDHWHESYEDAPKDCSAWIEGGDAGARVLRGGSWDFHLVFCRSAYRFRYDADHGDPAIGFRVVCSAPKILQ